MCGASRVLAFDGFSFRQRGRGVCSAGDTRSVKSVTQAVTVLISSLSAGEVFRAYPLREMLVRAQAPYVTFIRIQRRRQERKHAQPAQDPQQVLDARSSVSSLKPAKRRDRDARSISQLCLRQPTQSPPGRHVARHVPNPSADRDRCRSTVDSYAFFVAHIRIIILDKSPFSRDKAAHSAVRVRTMNRRAWPPSARSSTYSLRAALDRHRPEHTSRRGPGKQKDDAP